MVVVFNGFSMCKYAFLNFRLVIISFSFRELQFLFHFLQPVSCPFIKTVI